MIKIYSTPKCGECLRVKDYLDKKRLFYQEIDMTKVDAEEQSKLNIRSVPIIEIDGKFVFSLKELKVLYGN